MDSAQRSDAATPAIGRLPHFAGTAGLILLTAGGAAAEPDPLETVAAAVLDEFVTVCGQVVRDPEAFLAGLTDIEDAEVVTSEDGRVVGLTYERAHEAADEGSIYASAGLATLEPELWIVDCTASAYVETDDHDRSDAAFRAALEGLSGATVIGGAMPRFEVEAASRGFSDRPRFIYYVTNWLPEDPLLHIGANLGDLGFDLWTHRLVDRR